MAKKPKKYTADDKARIALEALKGDLTLSQITAKYGVHATQINRWKQILKQGMTDIFRNKNSSAAKADSELVDDLYKHIGQLKVELEWLKKKSEMFS